MTQTLVLSSFKRHLPNLISHLSKHFQLLIDLIAVGLCCNLLLARWASHEGEGDLQRAPAVLQQLQHAVFVEDMAAAELNARFIFEVAGVANGAEIVITDGFALFALLSKALTEMLLGLVARQNDRNVVIWVKLESLIV